MGSYIEDPYVSDYYDTEPEDEEPRRDDPAAAERSDDDADDLDEPFCIYTKGRKRYHPQPSSSDENESQEYLSTQENDPEVSPATLGYNPPIPERDDINFGDIENTEPNPHIREKGRTFNMRSERQRTHHAIGTKAVKEMLTQVREAKGKPPFTGKLQRRHYREALAFQGQLILPDHPTFKFNVSTTRSTQFKYITARRFNKSGGLILCMNCRTFDNNVRLYGTRPSCTSCGDIEMYGVTWNVCSLAGKEYVFASTQSFAVTSVNAQEEIQGKCKLCWLNNKSMIRQGCSSPELLTDHPTTKTFTEKSDAMAEFSAISTAAWLKSTLVGKERFVNLMGNVCICKSRKLLKVYMRKLKIGLKGKPLPSTVASLDPIFEQIAPGERIDLVKATYIYTREAFDAFYVGAKLTQKTSLLSHTPNTLPSAPCYSILVYCQDTGLDEAKAMPRKPLLKATKENGLRLESISIQAATIAYLLRRPVNAESQYAISLVNQVFNLGDLQEGDSELMKSLYQNQYGADFEVYETEGDN